MRGRQHLILLSSGLHVEGLYPTLVLVALLAAANGIGGRAGDRRRAPTPTAAAARLR